MTIPSRYITGLFKRGHWLWVSRGPVFMSPCPWSRHPHIASFRKRGNGTSVAISVFHSTGKY